MIHNKGVTSFPGLGPLARSAQVIETSWWPRPKPKFPARPQQWPGLAGRLGLRAGVSALHGEGEALVRLALDKQRQGFDQGEVGEGLREVPEVLACGGVDLLGVELQRSGE